MTAVDLLALARGPLFQIALVIFAAGVTLRIVEILVIGRRPDYSEARQGAVLSGLSTMFTRSIPREGMFRRNPFVIVSGYIFHIGIFVVVFLSAAHIEVWRAITGFAWPSLPTPLVDFLTVASIAAMLVVLVNRLRDPMLRFLSTFQDYLVWVATFLAFVTGYLAFHHMLLRYELMLAVHIIAVEVLLVLFPFTKLMHTFTLFIARYYTGSTFGRKGVES
ncbi:respiratory nitrate reductase subunit gamma [Rhodobium gokarnense]|uniref:Nitrate reductase gamma subunit n=1 Tax=Rhodobium gokarnense TaxID=364296 RepID=A0ABT3HIK3_9HYPH|nr:respiratory nitrate reductase subunit gamma [Rhodobium gokarnense]MCW2310230.1 nitrate reductase gamma subunit [Rhodobium gokarnense]